MNIRELIEHLQGIADEHGDEVEVRLAQQPQWAFEYSMGEPVCVDLSDGDADEARDMLRDPDLSEDERRDAQAVVDAQGDDPKPIVYLPERGQIGYLPGVASNAIGWR